MSWRKRRVISNEGPATIELQQETELEALLQEPPVVDAQLEEDPDEAHPDVQVGETEELNGPFPGGPEDPSLLSSFKSHIAAKIWNGEERGLLKVHCHTNKLLDWNLPINTSIIRWRNLIWETRMLNLLAFAYPNPNKSLVSAFIERWHPETNTFHMSFGEMTITLDDVRCLTGLRIDGLPVEFEVQEGMEDGEALVSRLLGVPVDDASAEIHTARGSSVTLKWLADQCMDKVTSNDSRSLEYAARAYIMYVCGCVLFVDKSGARVGTHFLRVLDHIDEVGKYAWGTASLAYLYRQLGMASRHGVKQVAGFIPLLEAWIYEHFPFTRPALNRGHEPHHPLAGKWMPRARGKDSDLFSLRERLDACTAAEVVWNPYARVRERHPLDEIVFFHGCIQCFDIVEPYHPDRVLRQFGYVQTIPAAPLGPTLSSRPGKGSKYKLEWADGLGVYFRTWDNHVLSVQRRGCVATTPWECTVDYLTWFRMHSHPIVQNPNNDSGNTPIHTFEPLWDQHHTSLALMELPVHMWRLRDDSLTLEEAKTRMDQAYIALGGTGWDEAPNPGAAERSESSRGANRRRERRQRR